MRLHLKKLNSRGVAHHALIALLVVVTVAGIGAYRVWQSSAATVNSEHIVKVATEDGCWLAGRKYDAAKADCTNTCRSAAAGNFKTKVGSDGTTRGFCTEAVAESMSAEDCTITLHRFYIKEIGCARRVDQDNTNSARQCLPGYPNYVAENARDKCIAAKIAPTPAPDTAPKTDTISKEQCKLLGRTFDTTKNACNRVCNADSGTLLIGASSTYYCNKAVATVISAERCSTLHRQWLTIGCARRVDQKDTNNAPECVAGFPYYNSNSEASATGGLDVCEADKATAAANEAAGIIGGVVVDPANPEPGTGDDGDTDSEDPAGPNTGNDPSTNDGTNFKITVYEDINFKGKDKTYTSEQALLKEGWNDKVSSYKIQKGRWQLCEDKDYQTNCVRRWASNPDMTRADDGAHNDKVSSLRPVLITTLEDADEDIVPICVDNNGAPVAANAENLCPENSTLTCPDGFVLKGGDCKEKIVTPDTFLDVDKSFKGKDGERDCLLLGREWVTKGNGGEHGCSTVTCNLPADGAPRNNSDKPYCVSYKFDAPYAVKLTKKQCTSLHRIWVDQVSRCAQVPNRKDKDQTIVDSKQCEGKFSVYFIYKAKDKEDECFKPSFFNRAKAVTKKTGGALGNVLDVGPRAFCQAKKGWHWDKHSDTCKKDPPAPSAGTGSTSPTKEPGQGQPKAPDGSTWSQFCAKLSRDASGEGCSSACNNGKERNPADLYYGYDKCTKEKSSNDNNGAPGSSSSNPINITCESFDAKFSVTCPRSVQHTGYVGYECTYPYAKTSSTRDLVTTSPYPRVTWYKSTICVRTA